ncbi:FKBP-type peptidyl-prolyl cis-trans isomerase [Xylanibacter brevis]|uniref:FKBP-type peptidyl-prolyl cis-trans isomerase n=1 Tax=Xylanibacter brevis TaxID=83231 RepID=UPI0004825BAD|nr:FKBP-type peptidyl-prolyl cis-trans isomerase [Xylanibacter brevis]
MDKKQNKYISVSYQLYSIDKEGAKNLEEETQQDRPFNFISGFGFSLDGFENRLIDMEAGTTFDFTLAPADAFGEYQPEGVHKVGREIFEVNGKFDEANIFPGAVITMMDSEEKRFMVRVDKIEDDGVTLDTNHPLAGKTLQFTGKVLENREATNEEIQKLLSHLSGECGGCGGNCGGGCGGDCGGSCGGGCGDDCKCN